MKQEEKEIRRLKREYDKLFSKLNDAKLRNEDWKVRMYRNMMANTAERIMRLENGGIV